MSNLNNLKDANDGASNLSGIGNDFLNLNSFGNSNNTYNLNNLTEPNKGFTLQLQKCEEICYAVNQKSKNNDTSSDSSGNRVFANSPEFSVCRSIFSVKSYLSKH